MGNTAVGGVSYKGRGARKGKWQPLRTIRQGNNAEVPIPKKIQGGQKKEEKNIDSRKKKWSGFYSAKHKETEAEKITQSRVGGRGAIWQAHQAKARKACHDIISRWREKKNKSQEWRLTINGFPQGKFTKGELSKKKCPVGDTQELMGEKRAKGGGSFKKIAPKFQPNSAKVPWYCCSPVDPAVIWCFRLHTKH